MPDDSSQKSGKRKRLLVKPIDDEKQLIISIVREMVVSGETERQHPPPFSEFYIVIADSDAGMSLVTDVDFLPRISRSKSPAGSSSSRGDNP